MPAGTQTTGTRDTTYDLISVVYHALQGAELYDQYIRDAEQSDEQEVAQFFRDVKEEDKRRSDRAKWLLAKRLSSAS